MKRLLGAAVLLPLALLLAGCSGNSGTGPDGSGEQDYNLKMSLTDMPMEGMRSVHVTITAVRVHQSAGADPAGAGWREIPVTAKMPVDLMKLHGGVLMELCRDSLDPGTYEQVRLVMSPNAAGGDASRNYMTMMNGQMQPFDMPYDIKIVHPFTIGAGKTDVTLDFVASESMHQRGNGSYYMTPVINASSRTE